MKKFLVILAIMMLALTGCHKDEEEDIEYYSDYQPPQETQEVKPENHSFDLDSILQYEVNNYIADIVDPEQFDKELVAYLREYEGLPDFGSRVLTVQDDGSITYFFEDGHYEFDLILLNDEGTVVHCVVEGDHYSFTSF